MKNGIANLHRLARFDLQHLVGRQFLAIDKGAVGGSQVFQPDAVFFDDKAGAVWKPTRRSGRTVACLARPRTISETVRSTTAVSPVGRCRVREPYVIVRYSINQIANGRYQSRKKVKTAVGAEDGFKDSTIGHMDSPQKWR
ncbi:MAG: hypothetical protein M5U34_31790 [Chloroflexi bacterium]|nr:hypothetical protein [Chloroflexota bacterium]